MEIDWPPVTVLHGKETLAYQGRSRYECDFPFRDEGRVQRALP